LESDEQRDIIPKDIPNKYMFFDTVVACGKSKNYRNVKWDILPVNNNIIQNITRTKLTVVEDGEEEKAIADGILLDEVEYTVTKKKSLLLQNLLRMIVKTPFVKWMQLV